MLEAFSLGRIDVGEKGLESHSVKISELGQGVGQAAHNGFLPGVFFGCVKFLSSTSCISLSS